MKFWRTWLITIKKFWQTMPLHSVHGKIATKTVVNLRRQTTNFKQLPNFYSNSICLILLATRKPVL